MMLEELRRAAEARGIATTFTDATGRHHEVPEATLEAVLEAMGPAPAAAAWPPVVVARAGQPATWSPPEGEPATLVLESGQERPLPAELPGDLPTGGHRVEGGSGATTLVVAPGRSHLPAALAAGGRAWGWAAQLYAVRSRASWGIGDLGDLAGLLAATAPLGAGFALLNPLHAAMPTEPSPYNPSSRVFRNPLYLRIEDVPELAALDPGDRARVERLAGAGRGLLDQDRIDRPAGYRHPGRPEVVAFGDQHHQEVAYHAWLQWLIEEQLAAAGTAASGQLGVVNDLAIGFAPDGFDAWTFQDELAGGMSVGAPPDPLGPYGQDWGLPAFVPDRLAAGGYGPFAQTIRAGMAHAAGLRIDHVMGLFRLFWIPSGAEPAQGTYVRYPADDLLGILALESAAAEALVVGEDLGTVEPGVRERLAAEGVLSYRLAWFEHDPGGGRRRAAGYPRLALAATTTHDLPTVAGFFSGTDLDHLRDIGVATPDGAEQADQQAQRESLCRLLEDEGLLAPGERSVPAIVAALYGFLTRTPSMLVAATLEDAVEAHDRPNVPGTIDQRPNWSLPLPVPLDELAADPRVRRLAGILSEGTAQASPRS